METAIGEGPDRIEHHGGRPLDASRDDALRGAALDLLAEIGYDRLTIDAVASRAGAGKATIYRRWCDKAELVVDALSCQKLPVAVPDTGSLRGDLVDLARQSVGGATLATEVMIGLVSALPHDAELRAAFRDRLVQPHVKVLTEVFARAVARGEIESLANVGLLVSILPALVLHRLLVTGEVPDERFLTTVIDQVVVPLALLGGRPVPQ